ncbi:HlyD family secretion protein [Rhizobium sp. BK068]|uniref:HlyD family secretion protein n=1 Tax=Rhizobium sp. BK068 TaxID=2512130 RepID=UPI0010539CDA|nr:HlyD family secretion protein [Rhizobium sp. BK068]TCM67603.1 membrane fusion protein (multidrug efflux system) [Rhizobium sp. BK068]
MAWLRKKNQQNIQSETNITVLTQGTRESPAASPLPANKASPSAVLVPVFAIAVALSGVVGAGANWDWWVASQAVQTTDDAAVFSDVSSVSTRVSGTVEAINVSDYAQVRAGDLLFSIDRKPFEVALQAARAKLAAARAQLEDNDIQRAFQLTQIDIAIAQQQAATADEIQASKELGRQTRLGLDGRASSIQTLEKATAGRERAVANSKMAEATVVAQRVKLEVIAKQRDVLMANADTAAADVAARELDLGYADIRAPVDGIVAKRNVQLGNFVATGTSMISIVPLPRVYILANYKENQLSLVREGQRVEVSVDLLPGKCLHGTVSKISPASGSTFALLPPDNATGNFTKVAQRLTVRIELDPDQPNFDRLRPGMSVTTRIATKAGNNV